MIARKDRREAGSGGKRDLDGGEMVGDIPRCIPRG